MNDIEPRDPIALDADNTLVVFSTEDPDPVEVSGVNSTLLGIDYRPANGLLYGLSDANKLYTIDPMTGEAIPVSTLDISFEGGSFSGMDLNPVADRLRITGGNDQNFGVNVDTGEVTLDGTLAYAGGYENKGPGVPPRPTTTPSRARPPPNSTASTRG